MEAFATGVVVGIPWPADAGDHAVRLEQIRILPAGVLNSAIGVVHQAWLRLAQLHRLLQSNALRCQQWGPLPRGSAAPRCRNARASFLLPPQIYFGAIDGNDQPPMLLITDLLLKVYRSLFHTMTEDIRIRFGRRLQKLRKQRGWTQVQLAERLGLDRSYLADVERGKRNISILNLEIIARGFGLSVSRLLIKV